MSGYPFILVDGPTGALPLAGWRDAAVDISVAATLTGTATASAGYQVDVSRTFLLSGTVSKTAGQHIAVSRPFLLSGSVSQTSGYQLDVSRPAVLTLDALVAGAIQLSVSRPGALTAQTTEAAGQYVTVQVAAPSWQALTELTAALSVIGTVLVLGVLPTAHGGLSATLTLSWTTLSALLGAAATLGATVSLSVQRPGVLDVEAALSSGYAISVSAPGVLTSLSALDGVPPGSIRITAAPFTATGELEGGAFIGILFGEVPGLTSATPALSVEAASVDFEVESATMLMDVLSKTPIWNIESETPLYDFISVVPQRTDLLH